MVILVILNLVLICFWLDSGDSLWRGLIPATSCGLNAGERFGPEKRNATGCNWEAWRGVEEIQNTAAWKQRRFLICSDIAWYFSNMFCLDNCLMASLQVTSIHHVPRTATPSQNGNSKSQGSNKNRSPKELRSLIAKCSQLQKLCMLLGGDGDLPIL